MLAIYTLQVVGCRNFIYKWPQMDQKVIIFKAPLNSENETDSFERCLREGGMSCLLVPVLDFQFYNLDNLSTLLENSSDYDLILTSTRAVQAIAKSTNNLLCQDAWVVGAATEEAARKLQLKTQGSQSGSGTALVELIIQSCRKKFIYIKGNLADDVIEKKLRDCNRDVKSIDVYKTIPHPNLEENMEKISNGNLLVFFSPSGVQFVSDIFRKKEINFSKFQVVAIGAKTKNAALKSGFSVVATAESPTPASLLSAIKPLFV